MAHFRLCLVKQHHPKRSCHICQCPHVLRILFPDTRHLYCTELAVWLQLEGVPSQPNRASAPRQASQAMPPAGFPPPQPNRNNNPYNPQLPPPVSQSGAPDPYNRPPAMPDYSYRQPSGSQYAYPGQTDPPGSYQPPAASGHQNGYDRPPDYGRSSSDNARADAGFARAGAGYSRPNAESDRAMADSGMGRGGVGNSRAPPEGNRGYPERNTRGSEDNRGYSDDNRGYSEGSRGYPEGSRGYNRQPMMAAGQGFSNTAAQPASPSAVDAKKATYRYAFQLSKCVVLSCNTAEFGKGC